MGFIKKRKNIRYDFPAFVEYRLIPDIHHKVYKTVTVNIAINKGMEIEIQKDVPFCLKIASACGVTKIDERPYLAGFSCD